jgi:hypothetical protein
MRHLLCLNLFSRRSYKVLAGSAEKSPLEMMPSGICVYSGFIGSKEAIETGSRFKTPAGGITHEVWNTFIG